MSWSLSTHPFVRPVDDGLDALYCYVCHHSSGEYVIRALPIEEEGKVVVRWTAFDRAGLQVGAWEELADAVKAVEERLGQSAGV